MKKQDRTEIVVNIRETFEAQLPIVAAILAMGQEEFNPTEAAQDAIDLCVALEEELS